MALPKKRFVKVGLIAGLFVALWVQLGPVQLGGRTAWVVTTGDSMQPLHREGDLVIVREAPRYEVGDIVAAHNEELRRPVLHRVVDSAGDRFVLKGDNNDFLDGYRPAVADIIGKRWFTISGGGRLLRVLFNPLVLTFLVAVVAFMFYMTLAGWPLRRSRATSLPHLVWRHGHVLARDRTLAGAAALALLFLALTPIAWLQPATERSTREVSFRHSGTLSYRGSAQDRLVYPGGRVRTGDPLFAGLVDRVRFAFDYRFRSAGEAHLEGSVGVDMRLTATSGWTRHVRMIPERRFTGTSAKVEGNLDLDGLYGLISRVERRTGSPTGIYSLELIPRASISGTVEGGDVDARLQQPILFQLDQGKIQLASGAVAADDASNPFELRDSGSVEVPAAVDAAVSAGPLRLEVGTLRKMTLWGLPLSLILVAGCVFLRPVGDVERTEGRRILDRHGEWLVPVKDLESLHNMPAVELASIEGLLRMAEVQERAALYMDADDVDTFAFEEDGVVYFYRTGDAKREEPAVPSVVEIHEVRPESVPNARRPEPVADAPVQGVPASPVPLGTRKPVLVAVPTIEQIDEVRGLIERGRPVVADVRDASVHSARRIIDRLSGFALGSGAEIEEVHKRAFLLIPSGTKTSATAAARLLTGSISKGSSADA